MCDTFPNDADNDGITNNEAYVCKLTSDGTLSCGVVLIVDNCPAVANFDQLDADSDDAGDACDEFPNDATETVDTDSDGTGDNSDPSPNGGYACRLFADGRIVCG